MSINLGFSASVYKVHSDILVHLKNVKAAIIALWGYIAGTEEEGISGRGWMKCSGG